MQLHACLSPNSSRRVLPLAVFALLLLAGPTSWTQGTTATVTGTITDPSGAVVPGSVVTATNTATGVSHTATSDGAGLYQIPQLSPGSYPWQLHADPHTGISHGPEESRGQLLAPSR